MVTPIHIVPEWYFSPLYAVLRSVPNKSLGLLAILAFVLVILVLPFINKGAIFKSSMHRPIFAILNFSFFAVVLLLGWIGSLPILSPFYEIGQILTFLYFLILTVLLPFSNLFERVLYVVYVSRFDLARLWGFLPGYGPSLFWLRITTARMADIKYIRSRVWCASVYMYHHYMPRTRVTDFVGITGPVNKKKK